MGCTTIPPISRGEVQVRSLQYVVLVFSLQHIPIYRPDSGALIYRGQAANRSSIRNVYPLSLAGSPLSQPLRPHYNDGAGSAVFPDRASPRDISLALFSEENPVPLSSKFTALLPYFSEYSCLTVCCLSTVCLLSDYCLSTVCLLSVCCLCLLLTAYPNS